MTPGPLTELVIGIDPGIHGGIAFIILEPAGADGIAPLPQLVEVHDLPTVRPEKRIELFLPACATLLNKHPEVRNRSIYIEQVHAAPRQGVSSMFRFGFAAGAMHGMAYAMGVVPKEISPLHWQHLVGARPGPENARLRAAELFGKQADLFALKRDVNKAAAALIALAGAREIRAASR